MAIDQLLDLDNLRRILKEAAGEDESLDLDGDILDTSFLDLGFDSLALLETVSRVSREFDVALPDEVLERCETPRALLEDVNRSLTGV
ncbi:acyl carrier protein [Actinoplanes derwentensis]|uniref:Act minimal PKS acyl carrier protein n=1 Tax=Actinoplanes derwentensis TaxID=113562 RepID=A0A1H2D8H7_9ACTN|nr:acyl carrier protein [Actinoplanes derwentensis]GID89708.1 actinorhodin polyketide synthase acyl carrier protein [Actinoplanes derwentensis]SDT78884.1 act minimal PKS acyl carrier protein [Actinoplanes derwentensis]